MKGMNEENPNKKFGVRVNVYDVINDVITLKYQFQSLPYNLISIGFKRKVKSNGVEIK